MTKPMQKMIGLASGALFLICIWFAVQSFLLTVLGFQAIWVVNPGSGTGFTRDITGAFNKAWPWVAAVAVQIGPSPCWFLAHHAKKNRKVARSLIVLGWVLTGIDVFTNIEGWRVDQLGGDYGALFRGYGFYLKIIAFVIMCVAVTQAEEAAAMFLWGFGKLWGIERLSGAWEFTPFATNPINLDGGSGGGQSGGQSKGRDDRDRSADRNQPPRKPYEPGLAS